MNLILNIDSIKYWIIFFKMICPVNLFLHTKLSLFFKMLISLPKNEEHINGQAFPK
jgi:hypothetical protein